MKSIIIACKASDGYPVLISYDIVYTKEQETNGIHYNMAVSMAENDGYTAPFVCFDDNEQQSIIDVARTIK